MMAWVSTESANSTASMVGLGLNVLEAAVTNPFLTSFDHGHFVIVCQIEISAVCASVRLFTKCTFACEISCSLERSRWLQASGLVYLSGFGQSPQAFGFNIGLFDVIGCISDSPTTMSVGGIVPGL